MTRKITLEERDKRKPKTMTLTHMTVKSLIRERIGYKLYMVNFFSFHD